MKIKLLSVVLLIILLGSCAVPKDIVYFQGLDQLSDEQKSSMNQQYISSICTDDMLSINVTSSDPSVVTPFNPPAFAFATQGETRMNETRQQYTYLVEQDGYITFPILGRVKAAGLSKKEFSEYLSQSLSKYVKDPIVNVQIVNYKVTLMGELTQPGTLYLTNDRTSILDAIGQSGDLTINANRKNITIVRDINGVRDIGYIDLTDPVSVFSSPYYYLRHNDVIYVEPNKAKKRNARYSQAQQYSVTVFSAILSTVSLLTSVAITVYNNNK